MNYYTHYVAPYKVPGTRWDLLSIRGVVFPGLRVVQVPVLSGQRLFFESVVMHIHVITDPSSSMAVVKRPTVPAAVEMARNEDTFVALYLRNFAVRSTIGCSFVDLPRLGFYHQLEGRIWWQTLRLINPIVCITVFIRSVKINRPP